MDEVPLIRNIYEEMRKAPRLHLVTFRANNQDNPRHQLIGYFHDRLRKVSDQFFICRENNNDQKHPGYHFHALVSLQRDIKPNWFRKGIHCDVRPVNKSNKTVTIPESQDEADVMKYGKDHKDLSPDQKIVIDIKRKHRQRAAREISQHKKGNAVARILSYITKDNPVGKYIEWIYHHV